MPVVSYVQGCFPRRSSEIFRDGPACRHLLNEVAIGPVTGRDSHSYIGPALNDFSGKITLGRL